MNDLVQPTLRARISLRHVLAAAGPGLVAMLADTDAGSIITLAQSGAKWGYALLVPNLLFIPFMFIAQELASRLGLGTGQGAGELVMRRWGRGSAILLLLTLAVSCFGALVSEMSGLAGAGATYGIPVWVTMTATVFGLTVMIATGSYRSVERIALFFGSFEIAFFIMAWNAEPGIAQIAVGASHMPTQDSEYLYLLAANLGTSVIPWALLYQQSASVDKRLGVGDIKGARVETLAGVVLCQLVTSAFLIAAGATLGQGGVSGPLETVAQIGTAFTATLGPTIGKVIFILGLTGGALVGTIVVCLTLAWTFGEVLGVHHSLARRPRRAPWFYGVLGLMIIASGVLVASGINLIDLTIVAGVINAVLLPIVLGFLYWLGRGELPEALRLRGGYAVLVAAAFLLLGGVAVFSGLVGALL